MAQPQENITKENFRQTLSTAAKLQERGNFNQAKLYYQKLYEFKSDMPEVLSGYGAVLLQVGDLDKGIELLEKSLEVRPAQPGVLSNLSVGYQKKNKNDIALERAEEALRIDPNFAEACAAKANSLVRLERLGEAVEWYTKAIQLKPEASNFYNLRGVSFQNLNRLEEALSDYNKAIHIKPDNASAYFNKGYLKLLLSDFASGWRLFEWRWKGYAKKYFRNYTQKLWMGESLTGKTIFIHAEQGLGDFIQHFRYVLEVLKLKPEKLILEVPDGLESLVASTSPKIQIVRKKASLPKFDLYCPIMSLPLAFKTRLDTIPHNIPYLTLEESNSKVIKPKVSKNKVPKIALVWSGSANADIDFGYWRRRSIAIEKLEKLLSLPIEFHCLQKEVSDKDKIIFKNHPKLINHQDSIKSFKDTADILVGMDLLITIDTSVAHLAGALAKNFWLLLPFVPDYRWMVDRSDSPWYPTATLFRQSEPGNWDEVIDKVIKKLKTEYQI